MKFICPLIVVKDINRSRKFYEGILKQEVTEDFVENVGFGGFSIHLESHFRELIGDLPVRQGGHNAELYFEEDKVDEMAAVLEKEGVAFIHPVMEQPWRQKVVRFYDPDQHIIEVGESLEHTAYRLHKEGYDNQEVASITYMSMEMVEAAILKYRT
jgi:catechol 2,3-dioxygenase-like lactoylglutathione lyase family enzyme